ncbi:MAG: chemotaxis protein MotB [Halocynthiibacter sp.]|jgi:chemotaxis protein MotB
MAGAIWPGFVDAMTALLMVMIFTLTIFMVIQTMLSDKILGQETELNTLAAEIDSLAQALGLERARAGELETRVSTLGRALDQSQSETKAQAALVASLQGQIGEANAAIASFEAQVASLLAERDRGQARIGALEAEQAKILSEQEALQLALATARDEVDASAEIARLAAAKREALEALIADLQSQSEEGAANLSTALARASSAEEALSAQEAERLIEAAAAEALRNKLQNADAELTAMTLALEAERKRAEETLTLLAAAQVSQDDLNNKLAQALAARTKAEARAVSNQEALAAALIEAEKAAANAEDAAELRAKLSSALAAKLAAEQTASQGLTKSQERAALLAAANTALAEEQALSAKSQREVALLNAQVSELRSQLNTLEAILQDSAGRDDQAEVQIETLTSRLNAALAQVASEERQRARLEEAERKRLEEEAKRLERYQSEFFGRMREILGEREGVRIVGDRFVFSSEVLFEAGSADLAEGGRAQIARVAAILGEVAGEIPPQIDWVIRVDGHTDNTPLLGTGRYADNWELSQARALSVVRYMTDQLGFPAQRLAATGFGEYQPVNPGQSPEALAQNRRIELKLTEK